jgi:hypothetical protein
MRHVRMILVLSVVIGSVPMAMAQQSSEALPLVVQHAQPTYPPLARHGRLASMAKFASGSPPMANP